MVDGVIVKMRRDDIRLRVVRRMLHRGERVDLLPHRQHDNAAGMLPRRPADAHAAQHDALHLTVALGRAMLLAVPLNIAIRRLIGQRSDRPRPVRLPVPKNHFGIGVRLALVLPGKIQVNVRLLIALKPQKRLKRDIKPLL